MINATDRDRMTITLDSLRFYAYHGVGAQERVVGNEFEVTVSVEIPPVYTDDLSATVSYADIAAIVGEEMAEPSDLIEHVAVRIRAAIMERLPAVIGGGVTVVKHKPPIPGVQLASASVTLRW